MGRVAYCVSGDARCKSPDIRNLVAVLAASALVAMLAPGTAAAGAAQTLATATATIGSFDVDARSIVWMTSDRRGCDTFWRRARSPRARAVRLFERCGRPRPDGQWVRAGGRLFWTEGALDPEPVRLQRVMSAPANRPSTRAREHARFELSARHLAYLSLGMVASRAVFGWAELRSDDPPDCWQYIDGCQFRLVGGGVRFLGARGSQLVPDAPPVAALDGRGDLLALVPAALDEEASLILRGRGPVELRDSTGTLVREVAVQGEILYVLLGATTLAVVNDGDENCGPECLTRYDLKTSQPLTTSLVFERYIAGMLGDDVIVLSDRAAYRIDATTGRLRFLFRLGRAARENVIVEAADVVGRKLVWAENTYRGPGRVSGRILARTIPR